MRLAAHRQRAERAPRDADRQRGEPLQQRRRGEHAAIGVAAGLHDARGGVHGVADQRDLHLEIAEFAHHHGTAVKGGAEIGAEAEFADVGGAARSEAVEGGKAGAHAAGLVSAGGEPPGGDDLVADIFVDLAARLGDGERQVGDEAVEEVEEAQLAEALGDRGGGAHVDEQQRALLDARVVIAPRDEGEQHARAEQRVDAEQQVEAEAERDREDHVGAGDGGDIAGGVGHQLVHGALDQQEDADIRSDRRPR